MGSTEARGWFEDYLAALNRHDLAGIRDLVAPDVRRAHLPRGAEAWLEALEEVLVGFPDMQWKRIDLVVDGDRLAVHLRVRGTHRGAFRGIGPTGRRVNVAMFAFVRVAGGRVIEWAGTEDGELLDRLRP